MLTVFVQNVHQVRDVAGGQSQGLDLRQLGVGRYVRYTFPQLGESRVDALSSASFLAVGRRSPLHGPGVRVVVHAGAAVHRDPGRDQSRPVVVMVRVQSDGGSRVPQVLWAVAGCECVIGGGHVCVADQPARKVRRSSGLLVTSARCSVEGVVAVVVVHDRVVREARHEAHGEGRRAAGAPGSAQEGLHAVLVHSKCFWVGCPHGQGGRKGQKAARPE